MGRVVRGAVLPQPRCARCRWSGADARPMIRSVLPAPTGIRLGLFISQVDRTWEHLRSDVRLAEHLGFDHAWLVDHLMAPAPPFERSCLEAWTLLAALAVDTRRIGLGVLVSSNLLRHPAVLYKQALTVDHVSGGRLTLGLGTGWFREEHDAFGIKLPPALERVDRLEEAVMVIEALMAGDTASFEGRHYRLR